MYELSRLITHSDAAIWQDKPVVIKVDVEVTNLSPDDIAPSVNSAILKLVVYTSTDAYYDTTDTALLSTSITMPSSKYEIGNYT